MGKRIACTCENGLHWITDYTSNSLCEFELIDLSLKCFDLVLIELCKYLRCGFIDCFLVEVARLEDFSREIAVSCLDERVGLTELFCILVSEVGYTVSDYVLCTVDCRGIGIDLRFETCEIG